MSLAKKVLESYGVVEALEIWQMTKYEYEEKFGKPKNNTTVTGGFHPHKEAVETALNQGKKVPSVVLRDYPELSNNEYASKKDSDYIKKSKEKEVIQKVEAFNNVMVKKVEGTNLVTNYITGTRFALDGVEKMLKEEGIPFSKTKSGTIQITFNKDVNESLTVPMKFEIAMEKLAKKPVKVRLETMEYALKNMMERATEKTGNNMMIKEFSAHLLSVVQHGFKDIVDDDENDDTMEDDISESEINLKRLLRDKDRIYYNDIGDIKSKGKTLLRVSAKFDQDNTLVIRDHWDEVLFELKKPKTSVGDLLKELDKMGWKTKGMEFSFGESFKESKNESYQPKGKEFNSKEILRDKDRLDGEDFHGQRTRLVVKELSSSEIGIYVLGDTGTHYPLVTLKSPNKTLGDAQKELQKSKIAKNVLIFNESVSESKKFTVKMLREEVNTVEELKEAMKFYLDNATKMTLGEATAFRSTIRTVGEKLGLKVKDLNNIFNELQSNESLAVKVLEAHK